MSCSLDKTRRLAKKQGITNRYNDDLPTDSGESVVKFNRFNKEIKQRALTIFGKIVDSLPSPMKLNGRTVEYSMKFFNTIDSMNNDSSFKKGEEGETSISKDVLVTIADKLSKKIGVDYKIISSDEAKQMLADIEPNYNGKDPFFHSDGKVYIIDGEFTLETPIHEFSHPFVRAIAKKNPDLFTKIMKDILESPEGQNIFNLVKKLYPEDFNDDTPSVKGYEEIAVRALTEVAKKNINPATGTSFFSAIRRLLLQFKQLFRDVFGRNVNVVDFNENTRLQELADMLTIGTGSIDLYANKGKTYGDFEINRGMPFQESTILKMSNGSQSITIRKSNHPTGIYIVNGEQYHVENLGNRNINDFVDPSAVMKEFKGKTYVEGKVKHIDDFFAGTSKAYVYQITKLSESVKKQSVTYKKSLELKPKDEAQEKSEILVENIRNIIKRQKALFKKSPNSKQFIKDLEDLERLFDESSDDVSAIFEFVEESNKYINDLYDRFNKLKDRLNDEDKLSAKERNQSLQLLYKIKELASSYDVLSDINNSLHDDNFSPIGDKFVMLNRTINRRTKLIKEYENLGVDLIADWLYSEATEINDKLVKEGKEKHILSLDLIKSELRLASSDINVFSAMFGAAISSTDPITALAAKAIKYKLHEASLEDYEAQETLVKAFEDSGMNDHSKFIDEIDFTSRVKNEQGEEVEKSEKVKVLITEFNEYAFEKAKTEFFKKLGPKPTEDSDKIKEYKKKVAKWFSENTSISPNASEIVEKRRAELSEDQFKLWLKENTREIENKEYGFGITTEDIIRKDNPRSILGTSGNKIILYSGEFIRPSNKYANPKYKEISSNPYYQALKSYYDKANDQLPSNYRLKYGMLPQVIKENIDKSLSDRLSKSNIKDQFNVTAYDTRYKVQTLSGEEYQGIPIFYINKIDQNLVSENLVESIIKFNQMSNNYKHLHEIKANVDILMDIVAKRDVVETNGFGEKVKDAVTGALRIKSLRDAKKVNERLVNFIDTAFYGNKDLKQSFTLGDKEIDLHKLSAKLQTFTAMSSMAGNFISGISNSVWGNYQTFAESLGGKYYTSKDWASALIHYNTHLPEYAADLGKTINKSKDNQLIDIFDALQGEFRDNLGEKVGGSRARRLFSTNSLFFMNNATEHQIQITTMIAILKNHRVNLKSGGDISLYDAYEMVDGRLRLKPEVKFTERDKFEVMNVIHSMNKRLHGVYNEFDKGELQRTWYGKLALMFRKHIYTGIMNRYGTERLDVESGDVLEGYYRVFSKKLYQDIKAYGLQGIINYKNYTPEQKVAFAKTMLDIAMLAGIFTLTSLIGGDDDDEKKRTWIENMALLQLRRFQGDIMFYTFASKDTWRILNNPTVTQNTVSNIAELFWQLGDPYEKFERRTGLYETGDYKLQARFNKAVPILRSIINTLTPEEQIKIFNK